MKIAVFDYNNSWDLPHDVLFMDRNIIDEIGLDEALKRINDFKPDLIIEQERNDGRAIYTDIYKQLDCQKALWSIDGHITLADHIIYAKQFDFVFLAQSWLLPIFQREIKGQCFYLPLCHTQTLTDYIRTLEKPVEKKYKLSFVGNLRSLHVERIHLLHRLKALFGNDLYACRAEYDRTLEILRASDLTFNCSLNNDLNFRVWEAIAMKTPILTDYVTDIDRIQRLSDQLIVYDKLNPDLSVIQGAIKLPDPCFIKSEHTLTHRYKQLIHMIEWEKQYEY